MQRPQPDSDGKRVKRACGEPRWRALACDYDGTLAREGVVAPPLIAALARFRATGGRLVLVTGRRLQDLREAFPRLDLFDRVVAENGALLFDPARGSLRALGHAPPPAFAVELERRGVAPLERGEVIVATRHPHEETVRRVAAELKLDLRLILNKGAVMALSAGIDKGSGLREALGELDVSPLDTIGVGDAENDADFLAICGCGVAVADALPSLKERADLITDKDDGEGTAELIDRIIAAMEGNGV